MLPEYAWSDEEGEAGTHALHKHMAFFGPRNFDWRTARQTLGKKAGLTHKNFPGPKPNHDGVIRIRFEPHDDIDDSTLNVYLAKRLAEYVSKDTERCLSHLKYYRRCYVSVPLPPRVLPGTQRPWRPFERLMFRRFDELKPEHVGETLDESTGEVLRTYIGPLYDPPYLRRLKEPSEVTAHAVGYTD
jgi:hypothetical protein